MTASAYVPLSNLARRFMFRTAGLSCAIVVLGLLFTSYANAAVSSSSVSQSGSSSVTLAANSPTWTTIEEATAKMEQEQGIPDTGTGVLLIKGAPGSPQVPLINTDANARVAGIVSEVTFSQTFRNPDSATIEGIYVFPLPDKAALRSLTIKVGSRVIRGMIRERESAEKLYQAAKEGGRKAGIVKQQRPNLFTINVANIGPGEEITVEMQYLETVEIRDNRYSIRIPLTLTPRYSNNLVSDKKAITPPVTLQAKPASHRFNFTAEIETHLELLQLGSQSHTFRYSQHDSGYTISLSQPAMMDRDVELHWEMTADTVPDVATFTEVVDNERYVLGLVVPPKQLSNSSTVTTPLTRDLVMIIDTSGSMGGEPIRTAKRALLDALDGLGPNDRFNVIAFSDRTRPLFNQPQPTDESSLTQARRFINGLYADGGTEMMPALRQALVGKNRNVSSDVSQIVFVTDGAVGYEKSVFREISRLIGDSRLFTVGIGHAPNTYFMKRAAEKGRGTYTFIPDVSQVSESIGKLFSTLEKPVMKDLSIEWLGEPGELSTRKLRDLHAGEPLIFSARTTSGTQGFRIKGQFGNQAWQQQVILNGTSKQSSGVSTIWARNKIERLLDEMAQERSGRSISRTLSLESLTDNLPLNDDRQFEAEIVRLGLAHQLVTPYTSLVAIDEIVSRNPDEPLEQQAVPNLMPSGTQFAQLQIPQGATGITALWRMTAVTFFLSLFVAGWLFRLEYASYRERPWVA